MKTAKELFDIMVSADDETTSTEMMIYFAKHHVAEALKQASEKAEVVDKAYHDVEIDSESILNAYPLENIK